MINLIPNTEKKRMITDFYWRLSAVVLLSLASALLVAGIALVPSYFLSSTKKSVAKEKLEAERAQPIDTEDQETLAAFSLLDQQLSMLEKSSQSKFLVSDRVIREVLLERMPDIRISQISLEKNNAGENIINIRGTAASRDKLLVFRRALEGNPSFKKVDLPISNFVKGSNIQFSMTLISS